jgi:hypothetical protein
MNYETELAFDWIARIKKAPVMTTRAFAAQTEIRPLRKSLPQQSDYYAIACQHKRGKMVGHPGQDAEPNKNHYAQNGENRCLGHILIGGCLTYARDGVAEIKQLVHCAERKENRTGSNRAKKGDQYREVP